MAEGAPYWMLWEELVAAGSHWSGLLRRGTTLRLIDVAGGANVSALFFNDEDRFERYNMPDTLKAQHTAFLTRTCVCYSDMGRILCSITDDTCGWHDTIGGLTGPQLSRQKFGEARYQEHRNQWHQNAYEGLLVELGKYGMGKRDLSANINFFSRVVVDDEGRMTFDSDHCPAGASLTLRTEMDALLVLSNTPHPLAPGGEYPRCRVQLEIFAAGPPSEDDFCRNFRPECARAVALTDRLYL